MQGYLPQVDASATGVGDTSYTPRWLPLAASGLFVHVPSNRRVGWAVPTSLRGIAWAEPTRRSYSQRKASTGRNRAARRAGSTLAATAIASDPKAIHKTVNGLTNVGIRSK